MKLVTAILFTAMILPLNAHALGFGIWAGANYSGYYYSTGASTVYDEPNPGLQGGFLLRKELVQSTLFLEFGPFYWLRRHYEKYTQADGTIAADDYMLHYIGSPIWLEYQLTGFFRFWGGPSVGFGLLPLSRRFQGVTFEETMATHRKPEVILNFDLGIAFGFHRKGGAGLELRVGYAPTLLNFSTVTSVGFFNPRFSDFFA